MPRRAVRIARSVLSGTFFALYGLFALPFAPVLFLPLVTPKLGRAAVRLFFRLFVFFAGLTGLYRVHVEKSDTLRLRTLRGCIVVMNHVSLIDICVLLAHIPDSVCIVKAAARRNPFLSAVVSKLFIPNDMGAEAVMEEACAFLAKGVNVVIFPQGTRGGRNVNRGAARLSLASRRSVVALRIEYDPVALAKGQPWYDVGDRTIRIGLFWRGEIAASGTPSRKDAIAMTSEIARLTGLAQDASIAIRPTHQNFLLPADAAGNEF